ncbi:hypothetical protein GCM10010195_02310 [Kitasatospora griseola]|nr:hypothetical protein GCM10010195_02310 [Kitasatospora griseola]
MRVPGATRSGLGRLRSDSAVIVAPARADHEDGLLPAVRLPDTPARRGVPVHFPQRPPIRTEKTDQMSESIDDTTHDHRAPGADEAADGLAHGRHRGTTASDDSADADPHGRHRR